MIEGDVGVLGRQAEGFLDLEEGFKPTFGEQALFELEEIDDGLIFGRYLIGEEVVIDASTFANGEGDGAGVELVGTEGGQDHGSVGPQGFEFFEGFDQVLRGEEDAFGEVLEVGKFKSGR